MNAVENTQEKMNAAQRLREQVSRGAYNIQEKCRWMKDNGYSLQQANDWADKALSRLYANFDKAYDRLEGL